MIIIAIAGKKGVGKNYVAEALVSHLQGGRQSGGLLADGPKVEVCSFVDPMKEFMIEAMGMDRDLIYGSDNDKNTPTQYDWDKIPGFIRAKFPGRGGKLSIRDIMQLFGTEIMREMFDREIWVSAMERRILGAKARGDAKFFLVTDLRFPNEAAMVKRNGGYLWKVDGPQRGDVKKKDGHATEKGLDGEVDFDYTVYNVTEGSGIIRGQLDVGMRMILSDIQKIQKEPVLEAVAGG